jgi:WD40 repeat protein
MHWSAGNLPLWRISHSDCALLLVRNCSQSPSLPPCVWVGLASGDVAVWQADAGRLASYFFFFSLSTEWSSIMTYAKVKSAVNSWLTLVEFLHCSCTLTTAGAHIMFCFLSFVFVIPLVVAGAQETTGALSFGAMRLPSNFRCRFRPRFSQDIHTILVMPMQEHKLGVRYLLLQAGAVPQLWSSSDDKTVKVWAASDDICSGSGAASLLTITLPCVALACDTVQVYSDASDEDNRSVWLGCDDHVIRVWSCKKQQLIADLKHHKVSPDRLSCVPF